MKAHEYLASLGKAPVVRSRWGQYHRDQDIPEPSATELADIERRANELVHASECMQRVLEYYGIIKPEPEYLDYLLADARGIKVHIQDWRNLGDKQRANTENRVRILADTLGLEYDRVSRRGRNGGTYIRIGNVIRTEITVKGATYDIANYATYVDSAAKTCYQCTDVGSDTCLECSGGMELVDTETGDWLYGSERVYRTTDYTTGKANRKANRTNLPAWNRPAHTVPAYRPALDQLPIGPRIATAASEDRDGTEDTRIRYRPVQNHRPPVLVVNGIPSRPLVGRNHRRYSRLLATVDC